ncbi:MAG: NAD(P)-binding domain-containing protein [Lachnospiraceae bacterium]|nr:NAD(P)-binding domain-containing protein [Lachnospiraceae bacterium]
MKAILIGNRQRYGRFYPDTAFENSVEKIYMTMEEAGQGIPEEARDAQFLVVDAIANVPAGLMAQLPDLKIIHSEGVGYNGIDCAAAAERGIYVCNHRGANAEAVAEQAILLMLGLQRSVVEGDAAVRAGRQIQQKDSMIVSGITGLGDCRVGLIGFGDIGKALAKRLGAFGCEIFYNATHRKSIEEEVLYGVAWMEREEMLRTCDIISIHVPVTPETVGMVDETFLKMMRPDAILINTARGEIVDNEALAKALTEGWIWGAGLDTVAPEPVGADHPLLHLAAGSKIGNGDIGNITSDSPASKAEVSSGRLLFSPHIGGGTTGVFRKIHRNIWIALEKVSKGERPANVVNGI